MHNFYFKVQRFLFAVALALAVFACSDADDPKSITGNVTYLDSNEPIPGIEVRMGYYKNNYWSGLPPDTIVEFNTVTDAEGNYAFKVNPSDFEGGHWTIWVASKGLVQIGDKSRYDNCEAWGGHLFFEGLQKIDSYDFAVDSAAYLKVEVHKVDPSSDGLLTYQVCYALYSATNASPDLTSIHAIATGYSDTAEEDVFYFITTASKPNPPYNSSTVVVHVGDTTVMRLEY